MAKLNMVDAINQALDQEMQQDESVICLGEDVGYEGGVFRVTKGLQKKHGKDRSIDTPLAEAGIIGTSVGLAINGMKPVCEIQFSGFIYAGLNQVINHMARIRTRTRGEKSCPMVLRMPYSGGIRALEHHSESMEALFAHTPGLKVVIPATPYEAKGLLTAAIRDPDPVIFMEPKRVYRAIKAEVPEESYEIALGKADLVQEGSDLTLISYGSMLRECKEAIKELGDHSIELINLRTISPLDSETILNSIEKTGRCVIVHEGPRNCGVAAEISARIMEEKLLSLKAPVKRVTGFDTIFPLYQNETIYLPDARILPAIKETLNF